MGLNVALINGAVINGSGADAGLGIAPAERFCRPVVDDLNLLRSWVDNFVVRPNGYANIIREPAFGRCGQEDACS